MFDCIVLSMLKEGHINVFHATTLLDVSLYGQCSFKVTYEISAIALCVGIDCQFAMFSSPGLQYDNAVPWHWMLFWNSSRWTAPQLPLVLNDIFYLLSALLGQCCLLLNISTY